MIHSESEIARRLESQQVRLSVYQTLSVRCQAVGHTEIKLVDMFHLNKAYRQTCIIVHDLSYSGKF